MKTVIYGLHCPLGGCIRYIGKSSQPEKRLYSHIYSANSSGSHKERWIAKILAIGLKPTLVVLEELGDGEEWPDAERRWIQKGVELGWRLTNTAEGGRGASPLDEAARARRKEQMSRPEGRLRMSQSAKDRWADADKRAVALAAIQSEERRKQLSEQAKRRATPEYRAMMSARSKAAWADKEKRSRIVAGITEDTRRAVSEAARRMWKSTENKDKMLANLIRDPQTMSDLWMTDQYRSKQTATRKTEEYKLRASKSQKRRYQQEGGV